MQGGPGLGPMRGLDTSAVCRAMEKAIQIMQASSDACAVAVQAAPGGLGSKWRSSGHPALPPAGPQGTAAAALPPAAQGCAAEAGPALPQMALTGPGLTAVGSPAGRAACVQGQGQAGPSGP